MPSTYPLATVGRGGRKVHALDAAGRLLCNRSGHLTRDTAGGYADKTLRSSVTPLAQRGLPTCDRCLTAINRP